MKFFISKKHEIIRIEHIEAMFPIFQAEETSFNSKLEGKWAIQMISGTLFNVTGQEVDAILSALKACIRVESTTTPGRCTPGY